MSAALERFHPLIRRWFLECVGSPTDVQAAAWPVIASGSHVLATAPTGSGKTLTAFLWALNQLISGQWQSGKVRVLYVSPLKALNNDIQRNLLAPLAELRDFFASEGEPFPEIDVRTRSGDTEQRDRQRMVRHPPQILITTPESLNLILSSKRARGMLAGVESVILDEIHAVAGAKRGTHLMTAVERVALLAGEFQRIALSATVHPLETVAAFVGGYQIQARGPSPDYKPRPVEIVSAGAAKQYDIRVRFPGGTGGEGPARPFLPLIAETVKPHLYNNQGTLVFVNNRRHCERISMLLNEDEEEIIAYAHHGSLSREMRAVVEQRLKQGELRAIVATSSLELGIDVGALDEVVMVQTPPSVASAVQRVGRAGHRVGEVSRGTLYPTHGRDILDAAVMARALLDQDIEAIEPVVCPLDVLAQVIVSMVAMEDWDIDALYNALRAAWSFHDLSRKQYGLVVRMLDGRYGDTRLRALQPLVSLDTVDNQLRPRKAALPILYSSGGTIPDRGYFTLRRADSRAKIGELDEEFVWERRIGDTFAMGMQSWQIEEITHNDVLAHPMPPKRSDVPFWKAENQDSSFHFSRHVADFLESANARLKDPGLSAELMERYQLNAPAAEALIGFLVRQRDTSRADLPHRHHVLIEYFSDQSEQEECVRAVIHTLWGGRVNRPFAYVLAQAWENRTGQRIEVFANNDSVVLILPLDAEALDLMSLVDPGELETLLRQKLEQTGFFGAQFRENAARALLLPRSGFGRRMPLWLNRQRSKKILDAVWQHEDFPILVETWRTCLRDVFELDTLRALLEEVRTGVIHCSETATTSASPFAQNVLWRLTNYYMYLDDAPGASGASALSDELIQEAVFSAQLRPTLSRSLIDTFEQKAQRVFPEYSPSSPEELVDWLRERLYLPQAEWEALLDAIWRDHAIRKPALLKPIEDKVVNLGFPSGHEGAAALEQLPRLIAALHPPMPFAVQTLAGEDCALALDGTQDEEESDTLAEWLGEWLRYYGPVTKACVLEGLPLSPLALDVALDSLIETQAVVCDRLSQSATEAEVCDSENLEILLRLSRAAARPAFEPRPIEQLPLFIAHRQRVAALDPLAVSVEEALEPLFGYPMLPDLLETELLPARIPGYTLSMLDTTASESDLIWFGAGSKRIILSFWQNRELFAESSQEKDEEDRMWQQIQPRLFADPKGQYYFSTLLDHTGLTTEELTDSLWEFAWQGRITNDSFAALRKGIETKFKPVAAGGGRSVRRKVGAWKKNRTYPGTWMLLPELEHDIDLVDEEERNRERVRVLLERYGVLFRELLAREQPPLRWSALFKTLRRMELAGEILAGHFFEDVPGLQFISHEALRELQQLSEDSIYWMNAADPASLCGVDLPALKKVLPRRSASTHLVFHGARLVVESRKRGKDLTFHIPPDDPRLEQYCAFLHAMLTRAFQPAATLSIETINGTSAIKSPYLTWLRDIFEASADSRKVTLWRNL